MYQSMKYNIIKPKPLNFGSLSWNQSKKKVTKKDKNLTYAQSKNKYNLTPFGDYDFDSVPNFADCKPLNPNKQGKIHEITRKIKTKITGKKYGRQEKKYQRVKPQEGGIKETAYDIRETLGEVGKGAVKVAKKGLKTAYKLGPEQITRPPEELRGKKLGAQIEEITKEAGIKNREENIEAFKRSLTQPPTRRPSPRPTVIREPERAGMPPQPSGFWRGTPQQETEQPPAEYQQIPEGMTEEEMMAIQQYQQQPQRKLPPLITRPDGTVVRVQEYRPVSKNQSFINYRPATYRPTGREYSIGNQSTRPQGVIPIVKFRFATFGRRIRE